MSAESRDKISEEKSDSQWNHDTVVRFDAFTFLVIEKLAFFKIEPLFG